MYKRQIGFILILALIMGCSGGKNLKKELEQVKTENAGTDSVLFMLDLRLKEFSKEVKAMRETYNENHISLENLYKLNAAAKTSINKLTEDLNGKLAAEQARSDSIMSVTAQVQEEKIAGLEAEQDSIRGILPQLQSSIQSTQFQVDSIFASMDSAKLAVMEANMLDLQSQVATLDSSFSDFQISVTDHMMISEEKLGDLERHARVQDSANYDILSQLVLLENKIISLTNSFNELMAMPGTRPNVINTEQPTLSQTQPAATAAATGSG